MPVIIDNENCILADVDGTIFLWKEPLTPGPDKIETKYGGRTVYLTPHRYHIDLLKVYKARGAHITVTSANGHAWAANAVKLLGLEDTVDVVMSKYTKYVDDTPADKWMTQVFIPDLYDYPKPQDNFFWTQQEPGPYDPGNYIGTLQIR